MKILTGMCSVLLLWSGMVLGQTRDSSADANEGFVKKVEASKGVVIRVPVNEQGEENTQKAELRVHVNGTSVQSSSDVLNAWAQSADASKQQEVKADETVDSSTCGWWGYRYNTWARPYYYTTYRPTYYYYGSYYPYTYRYNYTSYGYRYYYYNSYNYNRYYY